MFRWLFARRALDGSPRRELGVGPDRDFLSPEGDTREPPSFPRISKGVALRAQELSSVFSYETPPVTTFDGHLASQPWLPENKSFLFGKPLIAAWFNQGCSHSEDPLTLTLSPTKPGERGQEKLPDTQSRVRLNHAHN